MAQSAPVRGRIEAADKDLLPRGVYVEHTDAGGLVYENIHQYDEIHECDRIVGRRYVGFVDVESWEAMRAELESRGHSAGDLYHLPEYRRP